MTLIPTTPEARIRLAKPDVDEREAQAIAAVLATGIYTNGSETAAFEREFAALHDVAHAVAMSNGTVALAAMYLALGIGAGDEVVVPSLTFVSTATSVLHVGATPVFADVLPDTFDLDADDVARRITPRTKAVVVVHYAGQPADLPRLRAVTDAAGVPLLEDAAQAHGARLHGRPVGAAGAAAMFSFTPTKNITTGEGGMVTTGSADLAQRLRLLRNHGQAALYRHEALGWNWRLTEMQAAMGRVQLTKLDGILARKRALAAELSERLADVPGVTVPVTRPGAEPVHMIYSVLVQRQRDRVRDRLLQEGIEVRTYFPPAHLQPVFGGHPGTLPVTERLATQLLSLPLHSRLTRVELGEVADALIDAVAAER